MNTVFLLMAQYGATAVVPVELVCRDYFSHLTVPQFVRKVSAGDIAIPLVRMEKSQKSVKGVHIQDLASYIDGRRAAALKECQQLRS
ncbi:Pyocin activator protein PrtN [Burkholderia ubonensis]|uniref:pyocin activator PrtN family protein n=1 Tax=Burkholderia ubonensis TaxID=101571 RepID=UPI0007588C5C|nr:pyocin activator PrtN family protein [Burkholderia ubonensis]KVU21220.1 Pyocin activator protein PrtN [Burkholderia ubonensis]